MIEALMPCLRCENDINRRDSKGVLIALKLFYEGLGVYEQIACACGIQTKKVLLDGEGPTARDIWNNRRKP